MEGAVTALLCRTSDRIATTAEGARALAEALAERMRRGAAAGRHARRAGARRATTTTCATPAAACWRPAARSRTRSPRGRFPVLTSSDCSICITTLPAVARLRPEAWVLWLDAHPDFNDPETTPSGFLGGMCLAAACGAWDAGFDGGHVDPARVVMCGIRDVDAGERVLVETHGVGLVERPSRLAELLAEPRGLRAPRPRRPRPAASCPACTGRSRAASATAACARCWPRSPRRRRHHRRRDHRPPGARPRAPRGHDRRAAAAVTDVVALVGRTSDRAHGRAAGAAGAGPRPERGRAHRRRAGRAARRALRRGPARRARDARGGRRHVAVTRRPAADRHRLLDLRRHGPRRRAPLAGRVAAVARRARRLQHARHDAQRLPRRHVPGGRRRPVGHRLRRRPGARAGGPRGRPRPRRRRGRAHGAPRRRAHRRPRRARSPGARSSSTSTSTSSTRP